MNSVHIRPPWVSRIRISSLALINVVAVHGSSPVYAQLASSMYEDGGLADLWMVVDFLQALPGFLLL